MFRTYALILLLLTLAVPALAQTDPPLALVWAESLVDFHAKMLDPNVTHADKIQSWQLMDATGDYHAATAITLLAQRDAAELAAMANAIAALADSQTRIARAMEDMVWFERSKMWPSIPDAPLPIDINTASPQTLMQIVGPRLAFQIANIATTTPFGSVDDLILLTGMDQTTLDMIKPYLSVN